MSQEYQKFLVGTHEDRVLATVSKLDAVVIERVGLLLCGLDLCQAKDEVRLGGEGFTHAIGVVTEWAVFQGQNDRDRHGVEWRAARRSHASWVNGTDLLDHPVFPLEKLCDLIDDFGIGRPSASRAVLLFRSLGVTADLASAKGHVVQPPGG